jgi:hypothetical protein
MAAVLALLSIAVCAASGHAITVRLKSLMNSRRLMGFTPVAENHLPESLLRSFSESAPHCSRECAPMSAMGHKRTFRQVRMMSALPPKADIRSPLDQASARDKFRWPMP